MMEKDQRQPPFISVVIPTLNCETDVADCVAALRAQDYPADRLEILIVDNGSTDGTLERIRESGAQALTRPERGRARALNEGLQHARGTIICTTDLSCRPEPQWLAEIARSFEDPAVGCVAGEIKMLPGPDNAAIRYQERHNYMSPMSAMERNRPPYLPYADGANASFRREVFDAIGPFEETFIKAADVEICYRMLFLTDYQIAFNPRAVVWEPGEETLRALIEQRYRIGIGNVLLRARFPALYAERQPRSVRTGYWAARGALAAAARMLGLLARGAWRPAAREALADALIARAMALAQAAGRRRGQRLLHSLAKPPEPLEAERIAGYVAGAWPAASRIVAGS